MLSAEEIREIEREIETLPDRKAACIEALKAVQRHRGWVSDEAIADVARFLEMDPSEVDGVATFYNLIFRRPVGRHVILCCDCVSCWIVDGDRLQRALEGELGIWMGETTPDGRFTLLPIACLGACDQAPVMMIGERTFVRVTPERLPILLEEHR